MDYASENKHYSILFQVRSSKDVKNSRLLNVFSIEIAEGEVQS